MYSVSDTLCCFCYRPIPSADIIKHSPCSRALCTVCLTWYVDKILQEHTNSTDKFSVVRCPSYPTCVAPLKPEVYRDIIPSNLFHRWSTAHQVTTRATNEVEQHNITTVVDETLSNSTKNSFQADSNKGKQPVTSNTERKQHTKSTGSKFYCKICLQWKHMSKKFAIRQCSHVFCRNCVISYLKVNINEKVISIKCPDSQCKDGILDRDFCNTFLSQTALDKWDIALCEVAIGAKMLYCPFSDCSAMLVNDNNEVAGMQVNRRTKYMSKFFAFITRKQAETNRPTTNAECPHCHRMFCSVCRVPWHSGMSCKEFQTDYGGDDESSKHNLLLRKLVVDEKWQRCPNCKMFVEKNGGCMAIKCRCGYTFCYVCASKMTNHYCKKCKR